MALSLVFRDCAAAAPPSPPAGEGKGEGGIKRQREKLEYPNGN